jgi:hypothetical protein
MVGVLVGDQDGVDAFETRPAQRFKPPKDFLSAKARVNEESGVFGFEQRRVARAAGGQDGDSKGNAQFLRATREILARRKAGVKGNIARRPIFAVSLAAH